MIDDEEEQSEVQLHMLSKLKKQSLHDAKAQETIKLEHQTI